MTQSTYKPFPLINVSLIVDESVASSVDRTYIHSDLTELRHRPFPINTVVDAFAASQHESNHHLIGNLDTINLGEYHDLVVRTDAGEYEIRPIHLTKVRDDSGNFRVIQFGGPAVGVMGEINVETGAMMITAKDPHIVGIYLEGDRRDPSYLPTETAITDAVAQSPDSTGLVRLSEVLGGEDELATLSDVSAAMADSMISLDDAIDTVSSVGYVALRGTNVVDIITGLGEHFTKVGYTFETEQNVAESSTLFRLTGDFRLLPVDTSLTILRSALAQIEKLWIGQYGFSLHALRDPDDVIGRIRLIDNRQFEYMVSVGNPERWDDAEIEGDELETGLARFGETLNALIQIRHGADFRFEIVEAEGIEVILPVAPWEIVGHSAPGTRLVVGKPYEANAAVEDFDPIAAMQSLGLPEVLIGNWEGKLSFVEQNAIRDDQYALQLTFSGDLRVYVLLDGTPDKSVLEIVQQWFASYLTSYLRSAELIPAAARLYSVETNIGGTMLANTDEYSSEQLAFYRIAGRLA